MENDGIPDALAPLAKHVAGERDSRRSAVRFSVFETRKRLDDLLEKVESLSRGMRCLQEGISFALPHYRKARDCEGTLLSFRASAHQKSAEEWVVAFACDGRDLAVERVADIRDAVDAAKAEKAFCAAEVAEAGTGGRSALEAWVSLALALEALPSMLNEAERVLRAFDS